MVSQAETTEEPHRAVTEMVRAETDLPARTTTDLAETSLIRMLADVVDLKHQLKSRDQDAETTTAEELVRKRIRETRRILLTSRKR